jgi:hypothetical protein
VPYALKASDAETLGGRPASAYALAPASAGHDGASAAAATSAGGTETTVEAPAVMTGTPNYVAKYMNTTDVGNSSIFDAGTGVGIGTTNPADSLHIQFNNQTGSVTGLAVQNVASTNTSYSGMLFYDQNGILGQFQGFNNGTHEYRINNIAKNGSNQNNGSINFMIGGTSRFLVTTNGNIGIGTGFPATNLEVANPLTGTSTANIWSTTYGNTSFASEFVGRKARGTSGTPTAVQGGDPLVFFGARAFGATSFGPMTGWMAIRAMENWTDAARGTQIDFSTTQNGTNTPQQRMVITPWGDVGIGTFGPQAALHVARNGPTTVRVTSYGDEPVYMTEASRGNQQTPTAVQTGDLLGAFFMGGYGATRFGDGGAALGSVAAENWTDTAQGSTLGLLTTPLGASEPNINVVVLASGDVGIGTPPDVNGIPTAADKLQVFGDIRVGTTGTNGCVRNFNGTGIVGSCSSDRRFKTNITPFGPVLDRVAGLQPVHYYWRASEFPDRHFGDQPAYGLVAQDVEQVLPELVVTQGDGFKAVDYSALPLLTIQAVKELKAENDQLKARVAELERLFAQMQSAASRQ